MNKQYSWPEGHWNWPISLTHQHGVRCGQMIWVGGQVDLDEKGIVLNPGQLENQVAVAVANFDRVLNDIDAALHDLVKLTVFYVSDAGLDEAELLQVLAGCLPVDTRTAVTCVPVPMLAYPDMMIEIEGYAMKADQAKSLARQHVPWPQDSGFPAVFVRGLKCDNMLFLSACSPDPECLTASPDDIVSQTESVLTGLKQVLHELGAEIGDVVKMNRWYVGFGTEEDFEPAALACGAHFSDPGPCATGIPVPKLGLENERIRIEFTAMRAADGTYLPRRHVWPNTLWDWTIDLPYKHGLICDGMIFLGGQVSIDKSGRAVCPDDICAQTCVAMDHIGTILRELGVNYTDVCKVTTFYSGSADAKRLHDNLSIRSSYFDSPGPATTGIPMPILAYPSMTIEIEVFGMVQLQ